MRSRLFYVWAATLLIVGSMSTAMEGVPHSPFTAQSGDDVVNLWGGEHVELELTRTGANLDFDCVTGTIDHPLVLPNEGKFRTTGTYTRERPGPVIGNGNQAASAVYSGTIKGESMHLEVTLVKDEKTVGTFELVHGRSGRVMKCR
ncbi:MAG: hypothetical protein WA655_14115 [Candidatus Korobacteraceae bacterium]